MADLTPELDTNTLTNTLRTVLEEHDIPTVEAQVLGDDLLSAIAECFAQTSTRAVGVPMPIDLAMALAERGILRFDAVPRKEP